MKIIPRARLDGPLSMVHFLTRNCPARCPHCFTDYDDPEVFKKELTLEEIKRIVPTVGTQLRNVHITGGEPFLRKDIFEITRCYWNHCKKLKSVYITTNGYYTDRTHEFIKQYLDGGHDKDRSLFFALSVDDFEEAHNEYRKLKGLYRRVLNTHNMLESYRDRRVFPMIALTIVPNNYKIVGDLYEHLIEKEGVRGFVIIIMREEGTSKIPPDLRANLLAAYRDLNQRFKRDVVSGRIRGAATTGLGDFVNAKSIVLRSQQERIFESGEFTAPCYAGEVFLVLEANGDVRPCEILPTVIGNVRESGYDLNTIWKSEAALQACRDIKSSKCVCTYECVGAFNAFIDTKYYPRLLRSVVEIKARKAARKLSGESR